LAVGKVTAEDPCRTSGAGVLERARGCSATCGFGHAGVRLIPRVFHIEGSPMHRKGLHRTDVDAVSEALRTAISRRSLERPGSRQHREAEFAVRALQTRRVVLVGVGRAVTLGSGLPGDGRPSSGDR
jgi:hypothetical protein